jgi:DHA1 family inner membrane transport protein
MPAALLALALSAFAIGTTEFVIMGLLPEVAASFAVSIPLAGWLVSAYALGVAIGAPVMAVATARLPRRSALMLLMAFFVAGNLLCALAPSYRALLLARIVTALCHGAFFGIGSVTAAALVAPERKARAVALMFTGLTLANVLGVPLGTALGQAAGWRATFVAVTAIGLAAMVGLYRALPPDRAAAGAGLRAELAGLADWRIARALATTTLFSAAMFALFTYVAPLLLDVTGLSEHGVSWILLLIGVGLTLGNLAGGRLADWRLRPSLVAIFIGMAVIPSTLAWSSASLPLTAPTLFLWAAFTFAAIPALQIDVVSVGRAAPNLVSTLNISAFNIGNALGAWVGGSVIDHGLGLTRVPLAAGVLALLALTLTLLAPSRDDAASIAA